MFSICLTVDSISRSVNNHSLAIAFAQELESTPISQVIVVSGQHDDRVRSLRAVDHKIIAGSPHTKYESEYGYSQDNKDYDSLSQGALPLAIIATRPISTAKYGLTAPINIFLASPSLIESYLIRKMSIRKMECFAMKSSSGC